MYQNASTKVNILTFLEKNGGEVGGGDEAVDHKMDL